MPRGSAQLTNARREEIINACKQLYNTMSFKEITIKEIASYTSFTRPSIYNYFETKEEIFLAILQKEYELWVAEIESVINNNETMTGEQVAKALASSLENRALLLKLMSMNHYDMEANSRMERLVEFKKAYGASLTAVSRLVDKFCNDVDRSAFIYNFFPFIYGIYPYAVVTEKQKVAMEQAGIDYQYHSIYELAYHCALKLLKNA
ncbi:MAG: TetR/AcrR family transcriptional regulator [Ruminococcaceae bacterium]|nr:TetR/AcrR family transcriptional regulator [Oscillospiraceae bacterium]